MLKLGDVLKTKRKEKSLTLKQASDATKIPYKLLHALENGEYDLFASDVYLKGFLKNYSKYLDMDEKRLIALWRREKSGPKESTLDYAKKPLDEQKALVTPGRLIFLITTFLVVTIVIFVVSQINKVLKPPALELREPLVLTAPAEELIQVNSDKITFSGKVEVGSKLLINGNEVVTNNLQEFRIENFQLNEGSNEIFLTAESYYFSKTSQIKLTCIYTPDTGINTIEGPQNETGSLGEMNIKIETGEGESWIDATVDGEEKLAQVIPPNSIYEFKAAQELMIFTPRVDTVRLTINDIEYKLDPQKQNIFKIVDGNIVAQ